MKIPIAKPRRPRIAVDFDGVIFDRDTGAPVPGTVEAIQQLSKRHELVVLTARHDLEGVREFLLVHRLLHLFVDITNRKPNADIYLDDRGLRFETWGLALAEIEALGAA